jgi:predicted Rossmann-fold nucleotide-binding protein
MVHRLPVVAVLGSGSPLPPERVALARAVGAMVAGLGAHLLTGAGFGVMSAAAEGFVAVPARRGLSLGMVPRDPAGDLDAPHHTPEGIAYPNPLVELAIFTALPPRVEDWTTAPSRNHVNVLSADAVVGLAGSVGTRNELAIAARFRGEADRPPAARRTVLLGPAEDFPDEARAAFVRVDTIAAAAERLADILRRDGFSIPDPLP